MATSPSASSPPARSSRRCEARDATSKGFVEASFTASSYSIGTDPAFMFGTVLLFGLNSRQQMAWLYEMGGNDKLTTCSTPSTTCSAGR